MSTIAARALALPFALLAFAPRLGWTVLVSSVDTGANVPSGVSVLVFAGLPASALLPVGFYLLVAWRAQRRHPTWQVDHAARRFVAPATPRWNAPWMVFLGWLAAGLFVPSEQPTPDETSLTTRLPISGFSLIGASLIFVLITVAMVMDRPKLILTADGLTEHGLIRTVTIAWDRIGPGEPPRPETRNPTTISVRYPEQTAGGYRIATRRLPAQSLHIDPVFLAATLRYYSSHPYDRAGIGSDAGLHDLRSALGYATTTDSVEGGQQRH